VSIKAQGERLAVRAFAAVDQLVHERLPASAPVGQDVFQVHQLLQVRAHLEVRPAHMPAHITRVKRYRGAAS